MLPECVQHVEVENRNVHQCSDYCLLLAADLVAVHQLVDELAEGGHLQVEVHLHQDLALHLEELFQGVDSVTQLDVLVGVQGVDFVVLAADEEAGDPQQLKIGLVEEFPLVYQHVVDELYTNV